MVQAVIRRFLIATVLVTLVAWPVAAAADPISIGIAVAGAITALAPTGAGVALGVMAAWASVVAAIVGPSFLIGKIMSALHGKPSDPGRLATVRQADASRRVIYGICRVGSVVSFVHLSGTSDHPNQYLCLVHTLSGHPLTDIANICFDGNSLNWTKGYNTNSRLPYFWQEGGTTPVNYAGQVFMDSKLGAPCEPAFPGLVARTAQDGSNLWTSAHRQDGCGSVAIVLSWNQTVFPSGPPVTTFDVRGKALYDPRTSTTAYSANAALCILDFLMSREYGLGCDASEINTASFIAAANVCEESIPLKAGGHEPRYQINGMFGTDANPVDILKAMAQAMAGYVVYSQGQWYAIPGVYQTPSVYLMDDDLRGPIAVQTLRTKRDLCNAVRGTMFPLSRKWQEVDFPPIVHPEHICDDSGFPDALQRGQWLSGQSYVAKDCVIDSAARVLTGPWATGYGYDVNQYVTGSGSYGVGNVYVCTNAHTSSSTNQPDTTVGGQNWANYWSDVTATYSEYRGGVYVCTSAHTASAADEPGIGANWAAKWVEAAEYIWKDLSLGLTTSSSMAQRIAKIELERTRRQVTLSLHCKLSALQLQPGDTFYYSHPRFGWTNKTFQVLQCDFVVENSDSGPALGVDLTAQETDSGIYMWDPASEEQSLSDPPQPTMPYTEIPGARPVTFGSGFTYTSTTTSVHIYWDYTGDNAIIFLDSDTRYEPSGNQNITGLDPDTTYWFYPYYDLNAQAFSCYMTDGLGTVKWAEDDTISPATRRARIAEWNRPDRIPLASTPVSIATPATGTGGGGGGGDNGCLQIGMLVKEKTKGVINCEDVESGDELWDETGYLPVLAKRRAPHREWCRARFSNDAEVVTTKRHPYSVGSSGIRNACDLEADDQLRAPEGRISPISLELFDRDSEKIVLILKSPHTFYASSDGKHWVQTHNPIFGT